MFGHKTTEAILAQLHKAIGKLDKLHDHCSKCAERADVEAAEAKIKAEVHRVEAAKAKRVVSKLRELVA